MSRTIKLQSNLEDTLRLILPSYIVIKSTCTKKLENEMETEKQRQRITQTVKLRQTANEVNNGDTVRTERN